MKIGYICTNYNNSQFTVDAVNSLVKSAGSSSQLKIIVVDNSSSADQQLVLRNLAKNHECVDLIFNENNIGYFPGLNVGIRKIREAYPDFEIVVIGNNDLIFPEDFCEKVYGNSSLFVNHPVISPDVVTLDGEHQNPHVIESISKFREFIYDLYHLNYYLAQFIIWFARFSRKISDRTDEKQHKFAQPIYQGHGSCYLIGPRFFECFGEFWAPTFLMGEEFFLSKQLAEKKERVQYFPGIKITHCCHGSLRSVPSRKLWKFSKEAHKEYRKYVKIFN